MLTAAQVIKILDDTVNWYRTLGAEQQSANQPSDLLILYANRQIATKVIDLAFGIARANAELLSSQAGLDRTAPGVTASAGSLAQLQARLRAQSRQVQSELNAARAQRTSGRARAGDAAAKTAELEGELAVLKARLNLIGNMSQFVNESDSTGAGANALKSYISAMQASIPATSGSSMATPTSNVAAGDSSRRLGIWGLTANVFRLSGKIDTIDAVDKSTAALTATFLKFRAAPVAQLRALSTRSEALAAQADNADHATMDSVRAQLDTVAWDFKQTAAMVVPLSQEQVLLQQYRHNLSGWHATAERQYRAALAALAVRVGVLLLILLALFAGAEVWRRAVLRYEHEPRRRHQWLLIRRVTLWIAVIAVIVFTFVTQLTSIATFAGLLTAGVVIAMQSVIVSLVGYFFLIGKYGIRIGDRVQIGEVTGQVVELGLVRMHLMELSPKRNYGSTGRIVGFANSIVFQAGGLFRQIPGVNFAWHDITLNLPAGIDYASAKERLTAAATTVIKKYEGDMIRQTKPLDGTLTARDAGQPIPQIQLNFSVVGVEALVRYPVYLPHAAEIDERISEELLGVLSSLGAGLPRPG